MFMVVALSLVALAALHVWWHNSTTKWKRSPEGKARAEYDQKTLAYRQGRAGRPD